MRQGSRGVSIVAAIVSLLILSIMGVALVSVVNIDQESRLLQVMQDQAFYAAQAGFEFGLREVDQGGYPNVSGKMLNSLIPGTMSVAIDSNAHVMTVVGGSGAVTTTHSITVFPLAKDCLILNNAGANVSGASWTQLINLQSNKICLSKITVDKVRLTWAADGGERVLQGSIDGVDLFTDAAGYRSGTQVDVTDFTFADANSHSYAFTFSSTMYQMGQPAKQLTVELQLSDGSLVSTTFNMVVWMGSG